MTRSEKRAYLRQQNKLWPESLRRVPREMWAPDESRKVLAVWRSREFLATIFEEFLPDLEHFGLVRMSVNRTRLADHSDEWDDGISWDELMRLKREAGYGDRYAIEIYPTDYDIVNVANMRHLWIFPEPLKFGWFKPKSREQKG